jgi:long-chain fatty acid transport protein
MRLAASAAVMAAVAMTTTSAWATDGYFQNGVGAKHKALAGAGTASVTDATGISINPAGLVHAGDQLQVAVSLFKPDRGFVGAGGPGFTPTGNIEGNETDIYLIPNIAYTRRAGPNGVWAFSVSGNGGMSTDYAAVANPACAGPGLPAPNGIFCGGEAGVNLTQLVISAGYAHDFGNWSLGVAPIIAAQTFEAKGLAAFGGVSSDPANLTNRGTDTSFGYGIRLGVEMEASENLRLGASYQSKLSMSEFDNYRGLFADQGDFDIPQTFNVGVAADMTDNFTMMLDYRWINYEGVGAVGNLSSVMLPFGATDGPGFGWKDVSVVKIGAEWKKDDWTFRGGFSKGNNPIESPDVTLNVMAPGTAAIHWTGGFEKRLASGNAFEFAIMYVPEETVTGIEVTPAGPNPGHTIQPYLSEIELTASYTFNFGN